MDSAAGREQFTIYMEARRKAEQAQESNVAAGGLVRGQRTIPTRTSRANDPGWRLEIRWPEWQETMTKKG
jgi:hypothetical protein